AETNRPANVSEEIALNAVLSSRFEIELSVVTRLRYQSLPDAPEFRDLVRGVDAKELRRGFHGDQQCLDRGSQNDNDVLIGGARRKPTTSAFSLNSTNFSMERGAAWVSRLKSRYSVSYRACNLARRATSSTLIARHSSCSTRFASFSIASGVDRY